ncbi:hypothetical protein KIN20_032177 [Parelaphostrongylus tenuis]|uniref:Uncharacterized protein n=1 Tax=Parelaphostrongylus tenuis TaxID=148309 RepID=A0AAD5R674_PARTN|nr:hypothetical protein KIN20_032177 [Parelaphostrongylus tenuis]
MNPIASSKTMYAEQQVERRKYQIRTICNVASSSSLGQSSNEAAREFANDASS